MEKVLRKMLSEKGCVLDLNIKQFSFEMQNLGIIFQQFSKINKALYTFCIS
jgi:hypothetical protein